MTASVKKAMTGWLTSSMAVRKCRMSSSRELLLARGHGWLLLVTDGMNGGWDLTRQVVVTDPLCDLS